MASGDCIYGCHWECYLLLTDSEVPFTANMVCLATRFDVREMRLEGYEDEGDGVRVLARKPRGDTRPITSRAGHPGARALRSARISALGNTSMDLSAPAACVTSITYRASFSRTDTASDPLQRIRIFAR